MHSSLITPDEIDYNLYPALLQVFVIIFIGYLANSFQLLDKNQVIGLNKFVSTFALPALLFRSIAVLDFSSVNWLFLTSIFLSKTVVFLLAIFVTLIVSRKRNIGLAAAFGIFVSQSNDFALGVPILKAVYSTTHPKYLDYIYLIAPISLCILNPISFIMMEANEIMNNNDKEIEEQNDQDDSPNSVEEDILNNECSLPNTSENIASKSDDNASLTDLDEIKSINRLDIKDFMINKTIKADNIKKLSKIELIKTTLFSTLCNPIVFMTIIGVIFSFILKRRIPVLIDPILLSLSDSFSALALFYLGFTMFGKIKNLKFSSVIIIMTLIFAKSIVFPLITREFVLHLNVDNNRTETESMSTFGFLYGTFPTAPSLFFFITRFKSIDESLISSALVFGTLASAPLMMISGKMISLKYNSSIVENFDDIQCKTAFGFSFLSWFCCLWVFYILVVSKRVFIKSHIYVFCLILSQMLNAFVYIVWSNLTSNQNQLSSAYVNIYIMISLFASLSSRSWPLVMILNLSAINGLHKSSRKICHLIPLKIGDNKYLCYFIGIALPFIISLICLLIGGFPEKQNVVLSLGKRQIIISSFYLLFIVVCAFYSIVVFTKSKNKTRISSLILNNTQIEKKYQALINQENNDDEFKTVDLKHEEEIQILTAESQSSEKNKNNEEHENDKMSQQIALIILLTFTNLMSLFFQMWILFDELKSGIFYELKLIDTTILYGQGFLTFLVFGFDSNHILSPISMRIKKLLKLDETLELIPLEKVPNETIQFSKIFIKKYKLKFLNEIAQKPSQNKKTFSGQINFKGCDLIDWLLKEKIIQQRLDGEEIGKKLVLSRAIRHVSKNKDFIDGLDHYEFIQ